MKHKVKRILDKTKRPTEQEKIENAAENAPRITTTSIATHREEVLSSARKYILPLQHSKHQIVIITTTLFIAAVLGFFGYTTVALYKFQNKSTFMYHVTQVLPFPVAKVGSHYVSYENYLFELRHFMHYYESQQKTNFADQDGQEQLKDFKRRSLDKVINDAYVNRLAKQHNISVSSKEVNDQVAIVRSQNRLGSNDKVFEDVLKDYWGWSVDDFKRSLSQELLAQKVVSALDTDTHKRADSVLAQLQAGGDFTTLAKQYSDDPTKANGGDLGYAVDRTDRNLNATVTEALFKLQPGKYSSVIDAGGSLVIVKNIEASGEKIRAAQIVFNFKDINTYVNDLKDTQKSQAYIKL